MIPTSYRFVAQDHPWESDHDAGYERLPYDGVTVGSSDHAEVSLRSEENRDELCASKQATAGPSIGQLGRLQRTGKVIPGTHYPWWVRETGIALRRTKSVEALT
jgi:hypothetical protein